MNCKCCKRKTKKRVKKIVKKIVKNLRKDEEAEELQHQQLDAALAGENEADLSECLIAKALSAVEKEQHHHNKNVS
jgi:hypothetical protein